VAKDKKKDKKKAQKAKRKTTAPSPERSLKLLSQNPLVADLVAAALVGTAAALRDPDKARQIFSKAGDELGQLAKEGAKTGGTIWQLAMEVGRSSLDALSPPLPKTTRKPRAGPNPQRATSAKRRVTKSSATTE
jgi:hypothetical protein